MSNLGAANALYDALNGAPFANAAAAISGAGGEWAGITIGPFAEVRLGERQMIAQHPAAIIEPASFDLDVMNHGGCDDNKHVFTVRVENRDSGADATLSRKTLMALVWAVRHAVFVGVSAADKYWSTRLLHVEYNGATPAPDGPMIASADCTVEIRAVESNDTAIE